MNDNFSVRGEVKLVDCQGNVLIDDHNMVVKLGRKFIRDRVLGASSSITISKLKFGYSSELTEVTESDDGIDVITIKNIIDGEETTREISFNIDQDADQSVPMTFEDIDKPENEEYQDSFCKYKISPDNESPYIKYVLYIHNDPIGIVNQLGLFTSDNKLFSKLVFEDVAITNDRDYLLTYTLYF